MNNLTKEQLIEEVEALEADLRLAKAELWESLGERDRLRAMGKRLQDERNTFAQELAALTPPVVRECPNWGEIRVGMQTPPEVKRGSLDFALQEVEVEHYSHGGQVHERTDVWVPACGGMETPFKSKSGAMLTYMWNQTTGEHAYYNHDTDTFLSYADALELM